MTTSAEFRANLAKLLSPLRRVRPRVPFYKLSAHRIPTLWSLYRSLLRDAPTENIAFRVRMLFRQNRHLTGTEKTRKYLLLGYKWLDTFRKAHDGDQQKRALLTRYSTLIAAKREKEYWKKLAREEKAWIHRLRNRPRLTGAFLRPSHSNPPLPRLKPQPHAISCTIRARRAAFDQRVERMDRVEGTLETLRIERDFEEGLAQLTGAPLDMDYAGPAFGSWCAPLHNIRDEIRAAFARDNARARLPFPPEMLAAIKQARRDKIANKTRERERERRGMVLRCTIERQRQGPPAHVLARMTPEQRRMDKIARSVGEVGYVARVKRKLGFRFKNPDAWKVEIGTPENKDQLDALSEALRLENERRMAELAPQSP